MNNLSNSFTNDELRGMITGNNPVSNAYRELLAYREAQGKVVAVTGEDEISNMHATGLYLRAWPADRHRNEVEGYSIPLFTAPQLPTVPDERAEFESFMSERFGDSINIRRAKNGDEGYMEWDVAVAWIVWQQRAMLAAAPMPDSDNVTDNTAQQFESLSNGSKNG